jgi:hypothetical protein
MSKCSFSNYIFPLTSKCIPWIILADYLMVNVQNIVQIHC